MAREVSFTQADPLALDGKRAELTRAEFERVYSSRLEPALMPFQRGDQVVITGWPFEVPGIVVGQKEIPGIGSELGDTHYLVRIPEGTEEGLACHPSRLRKT